MQQNWCLWVLASRSCRSPVLLRTPRWSPWMLSLRTTLSGVHGLAENIRATTHNVHPMSSKAHAYALTGVHTLPSPLSSGLCYPDLAQQLASLGSQVDLQLNLQALQGWGVRVHPVCGHSGFQQAVGWQRSTGRPADRRLIPRAAHCTLLGSVL